MAEPHTDTTCIWGYLKKCCDENNNRYRFKTEDGDYIIRYSDITKNYTLLKSKITKMTDEERKEKRRQYAREKYREDIEKSRAEKSYRAKVFAEKNPEKLREWKAEYYNKNKDYIRARQKERYYKNKCIIDAFKKGLTPPDTLPETQPDTTE